jgi:hypothetical protein
MKPRWVLVVISLALVLGSMPLPADAVSITVDVGGTQVGPLEDKVVLSGTNCAGQTYGNIRITCNDPLQGDARVIAGSGQAGGNDSNEDRLSLVNARITPVNTFSTEYRIAFWGTFGNLPTTTAGAYSYQLSGSGTLRPPLPLTNTDTVRARCSVEWPGGSGSWTRVPGTDISKTVTNTNFSFFSNTLSQNVPLPNIDGSRGLKGEFWFTLRFTTDVLLLSATTGILCKSGPAQGPGDTTINFAPAGGNCPDGAECLIPAKYKCGFWCRLLRCPGCVKE